MTTATTTNPAINEEKLGQFMEKVLSDFGGAASAILAYIGDKLGLYTAMNDFGKPITSQELADVTKTSERYVREWLANQAAGGYIEYDSSSQKYSLPIEHALALVNETSPAYTAEGFQVLMSFYKDASKLLEAFKTGNGIAWGDHDKDLFEGIERFFKPGYTANLVSSWIPALDNGNVEQTLKKGSAKVADIGCGHGVSTILMAKAYPNCKLYGFDNHLKSIEYAKNKAKEEGLDENRISFNVASSTNFPVPNNDDGYDLVAYFDCLHDMEDPNGAAAHTLKALKPEGTMMIVEPFANDKFEDNLNPLGRLFYAGSTMVCIPASLSQKWSCTGFTSRRAWYITGGKIWWV
ncbi:MAG TPA: class I SAM-dependent methyltransferase [Nitrososphaeraceae archaeon]|jgi:SAM-dependent methyltransferase